MSDATQCLDAERGVLGALLIETERIPGVRDLLGRGDFYSEADGQIYSTLLALFERAAPIDLLTLSDELRKANRLEAVGGIAYLMSLASGVATAAHAEHYAQMVRDAALRRRQRGLLNEAHQAYSEGRDEDGAAAIDAASEVAAQIGQAHSLMPPQLDVFKAIAEPPPEVAFLLPGLASGTVGMIAGMGATGKSALLLAVAVSVCSGAPVAGGAWRQPMPSTGPVLYLAAEDSELILRRRLHALGEHLADDEGGGKVLADLQSSLHLHSLAGKIPTLVDEHGRRTEWWRQVRDAARGMRLVILDPLSRFHGLDENDNRLMTLLVQHLEAIATDSGAAILIAHHASKAAVLSGTAGEQQAARGASALVDGARWVASLRRPAAQEAKDTGWDDQTRRRHAILSIPKMNYGEPPEDALLVFQTGGILAYEGPWRQGPVKQKQEKQPLGGPRRSSGRHRSDASEEWPLVPVPGADP